MGFPNVDIFLVDKFIAKFEEMQINLDFVINDTFSDLNEIRRAEIATYISNKFFVQDLRNRDDGQVYILSQFPMFNMPLPQIGISLGQENSSDKFLGDLQGESTPVTDKDGVVTHWDVEKGYFAAATYRCDVITATKDEAIWLARLIQRFICEEQDALNAIGVQSIDITLADIKLEQDQIPLEIWNRAVQINCKVINSWTKRIPVLTTQAGNNIF